MSCCTKIHKASKKGHLNCLQSLIEQGFDIDERYGNTALHLASIYGNVDCLQFLIDNGANINALNKYNETPLYCASNNGDYDCIRVLVEAGADVTIKDNRNRSPLHIIFIDYNDMYNFDFSPEQRLACVEMFINQGADVNARDSEGWTPLHEASVHDNIDIVRLLLDNGASKSILDNKGQRPSDLALSDQIRQLIDNYEEGPLIKCPEE